jgi:YgiT-type zinc finger domain-containing protein
MRWSAEGEAGWQELADEVLVGMKEWRLQHPKASLPEIEAALDERWSRVRARMLQDLALASAAADLAAAGASERPLCPSCGVSLEARGQQTRELTTYHDRTITLERSYAVCPACGAGLFPPG